jgi:hypothetical protein
MRILGYWIHRRIAGCLVALLAVPFGEVATAQQAAPVPAAETQPQNSDTTQAPAATQSPAAAQPPQPGVTVPVGTAAAPYEKGIGVAVSKPAGAVIAPAKQKRTRSILIKVGIILAAGVAIGTVVALSAGSPSKPN